jgi:exodeoxyribonuclease VII large subunit
MPLHVQSVSEITRSLKEVVEGEFRFVHIRGEVSNLKCPFSGHLYFTLKDSGAQIRAVLFKGQKRYLAEDMKDGQQLICHGRVSVYEPRGEYQLLVDTVDFFGTGLLQLQFEKQKLRLAAEGLFAVEKKKEIPSFPRNIVLITSPAGAAVHDFLTICKKRKTSAKIYIIPVRVQGDGASEEIAAALEMVNRKSIGDLIVLCRGGGSLEDLWAFNEECVARAIHASLIPVVTGIGHEIDFTIADFCADFRAPTPTGAAEKVIPDNVGLLVFIEKLRGRLISNILRNIVIQKNRVLYNYRLLGDMSSIFLNCSVTLDRCVLRLVQAINYTLRTRTQSYEELTKRLQHQAPATRIEYQLQHLEFLFTRLKREMVALVDRKQAGFAGQMMRLDGVSPIATLARGYSIVRKVNHSTGELEIIRKSSEVGLEDQLDIYLYSGRIQCEVIGKQEH